MNYCRQLVKECRGVLGVPSMHHQHNRAQHIIDLANASQKFLLPANGRLFDDMALKGLDTDGELRLPFPFITLEWGANGEPKPGYSKSSRRVVFVREDGKELRITIACYVDANGAWALMSDVCIKTAGWYIGIADGRAQFEVILTNKKAAVEDVVDEVTTVLSFLNALACSNVRAEKIPLKRGSKRVKSALQFDEYHVLTIDPGSKSESHVHSHSGRSPREHLRRGHIRRYESGLRVWVNATVVNHGIGGRITKDYEVSP